MGNSAPTYKGDTKRVVVIGGGIAGCAVAQELEKQDNFEVTMISVTDYMNWAPATIRGVVDPAWSNQFTIPHAMILNKAKRVSGMATKVTETTVEYTAGGGADDTHTLPYDYLVLALGSGYGDGQAAIFKSNDPGSMASTVTGRLDQFAQEAAKLSAASTVCIVGAGATGIELAAEIAEAKPNVKVTVVSRGEIVDFMPAKVKKQVAAHFAKLSNVTILTNTQYDAEAHKADLTYMTVGMRPSSQCLKDGAFSASVTESGHVCCDTSRTFQVKNGAHERAFAVGDITSPGHSPAPFLSAYQTHMQSSMVAKNVVRHACGQPLKPLKPGPAGAVLSLGRNNGSGAMGPTLPQFMVKKMKSGDLFTAKYQKAMTKKTWKPSATYNAGSGTYN